MGLFDKKFCDICGEKIGLLGNRKLEDGNMCKDCAKLLSPLFSDRRNSTLEEIKQQLAYREQNKQVLASFVPTDTFGDYTKLYIDRAKGRFLVSSYNPGSWSDENPDVQLFSSVTGLKLDIDEDKEELFYDNAQGESVSYTPPRYNYYYNFDLVFNVNNPYFDEFSVRLNSSRIEGFNSPEYIRCQQTANEIMNIIRPGSAPAVNAQQGGYAPQQNPYAQQGGYAPQQNPNAQQGGFVPQQNPYAQQGGFVPQQYPNAQQGGFVPQQGGIQQWVCKNCGATNNAGNFCQACGGPRS